jgi:superfamily II RNA helicase
VARVLYGYELQVTEMLYRGVLENLPPRALAVVFVGLIHEERRRFDRPYVPGKMFGDLRYNATTLVNELSSVETRYGIEPGMKKPDWGLTPATLAWFDGCPFEELEERTDATPGDVCRVFRMAVQLMRNVRYAIDPDWDLTAGLREAVGVMNREEIDARRQLQLG